MISRVNSKNIRKTGQKKKNRINKQNLNRKKKNGTKKQKAATPGVELGSPARASNSLSPCTKVPHKFFRINFVSSKPFFFCHRHCLKLVELYFS